MSVQLSFSLRSLRTEIVRSPCGDCAMPLTTCLRRIRTYDFSNLYKFPLNKNRRGHGARESVRKSHSRLLPPHGGLAEAAWKGEYGQDTGRPIAGQMWTSHDASDSPNPPPPFPQFFSSIFQTGVQVHILGHHVHNFPPIQGGGGGVNLRAYAPGYRSQPPTPQKAKNNNDKIKYNRTLSINNLKKWINLNNY